MSVGKRILLCAVTAIVLGAIAAGSASATPCAGLTHGGCISVLGNLTLELGVKSQKKSATKLVLNVAGVAEVECEQMASTETIDETETEFLLALPYTPTFSICHVVGHAVCVVTQFLALPWVGNAIALVGLVLKYTLKASVTEANMIEVRIEGCEQEAIIGIKGSQECSILETESELEKHEIVCSAAGSRLKDGAKMATFEMSTIQTLAGDDYRLSIELF
jgi:hypothetical protein